MIGQTNKQTPKQRLQLYSYDIRYSSGDFTCNTPMWTPIQFTLKVEHTDKTL